MSRSTIPGRLFFAVFYLLTGAALGADSDEPWQIHGQVIDELGQPTDDFDAATFWWANGSQYDDNGKLKNKPGLENMELIWKDEGVPGANPKELAEHVSDGKFNLKVSPRPRVAVFAYDKARKRGGVIAVEKEAAAKDVTIQLAPLTHVHGKVVCAEEDNRIPEWSSTRIHLPGDSQNYTGFTFSGSLRGEVVYLLPPGKYDLEVHSDGPTARMPKPGERKLKDAPADMPPFLAGIRVDVPTQPELDLGNLNVELPKDKNGVSHDISLLYGKDAPALKITDARGVPKTVQLSDYHGKWVYLDFWALWCSPCVYNSLPEATKFYEEHAADRDRFEIMAICNTSEEKLLTVADFEVKELPIRKEVWQDKDLPYPVLIDGEAATAADYGIQAWPTSFLIDPEGHLVKHGSLEMLAKKLEAK